MVAKNEERGPKLAQLAHQEGQQLVGPLPVTLSMSRCSPEVQRPGSDLEVVVVLNRFEVEVRKVFGRPL